MTSNWTRRAALKISLLPLGVLGAGGATTGEEALDFELPSASGGKLRLSSLRGKEVVLVFYRGYW
jgi:hypothetical protein